MAHNPFPFRRDAYPNLTRAIHRVVEGAAGQGKYPRPSASGGVRAGENTPPRPAKPKPKYKYPGGVVYTRYATEGVVSESHTRAQLEKMSIPKLRELLKKYTDTVLKGQAAPENRKYAFMPAASQKTLADIRGILRSRGAGVALEEGVGEKIHLVKTSKVSTTPGESAFQTLYRHGFNHYIVSYSTISGETMIFKADKTGKVTDWSDLWMSRKKTDHNEAIIDYITYSVKGNRKKSFTVVENVVQERRNHT